MKNIQFISFICLFSLLLWGCEQTIFINQNGYEPRVSVESDIAADSVPKIYLTKTQNYYGYVDYKAPVQYIENAKVSIIHNGVADELTLTDGRIDTVTIYNQNGGMDTLYTKQKYYRGHNISKKGEKYELKIEHEGKEITSELTVSNYTFEPGEAEQITQVISYPGGSYEERFLEIRIKDPIGVGSYYRAKMSYAYMQYFEIFNPTTMEYELDSMLSYNKQISEVISDELNDGSIIKLRFYPYIYPRSPDDTTIVPINISIECLDNQAGRYWEAVLAQGGSNGDPFTEPTLLYSNIRNGIGFFGAYQIADTLIYQWYP